MDSLFPGSHAEIGQIKNDLAGLPCKRCVDKLCCDSCWGERRQCYREALAIRETAMGASHVGCHDCPTSSWLYNRFSPTDTSSFLS